MSRTRRFLDNGRLVLFCGLAAAIALGGLWLSRATLPFLPDPVPVPQGETGSTPGGDFKLRGMITIDVIPDIGSTRSPLPGASFVAVAFDYSGEPGTEIYCTVELLGAGRKWINDRMASVRELGFQSFCEGSSGKVLKYFEIPTPAIGEVRGIRILGNGGSVILAGTVEVQ